MGQEMNQDPWNIIDSLILSQKHLPKTSSKKINVRIIADKFFLLGERSLSQKSSEELLTSRLKYDDERIITNAEADEIFQRLIAQNSKRYDKWSDWV